MSQKEPRNPNHPKAIEALERSNERKRQKAMMRVAVEDATKALNLRFVFVGRTTVAYCPANEHRSKLRAGPKDVFKVSTAICHTLDEFDKLQGRYFASSNMLGEQYILMRKPRLLTMRSYVSGIFNIEQVDDGIARQEISRLMAQFPPEESDE